jgi:hypothetical protein
MERSWLCNLSQFASVIGAACVDEGANPCGVCEDEFVSDLTERRVHSATTQTLDVLFFARRERDEMRCLSLTRVHCILRFIIHGQHEIMHALAQKISRFTTNTHSIGLWPHLLVPCNLFAPLCYRIMTWEAPAKRYIVFLAHWSLVLALDVKYAVEHGTCSAKSTHQTWTSNLWWFFSRKRFSIPERKLFRVECTRMHVAFEKGAHDLFMTSELLQCLNWKKIATTALLKLNEQFSSFLLEYSAFKMCVASTVLFSFSI